jgi:hypothetical protein
MSRDWAVDNRSSNIANVSWTQQRMMPKQIFAEAAEVAKPISTGPGGSAGNVREYRAQIRYLRKRRAALKRTVLQETWIYKLG